MQVVKVWFNLPGSFLAVKLYRERKLYIGKADAAHVAFAEQAEMLFISCDDRLIRIYKNHKINLPQ